MNETEIYHYQRRYHHRPFRHRFNLAVLTFKKRVLKTLVRSRWATWINHYDRSSIKRQNYIDHYAANKGFGTPATTPFIYTDVTIPELHYFEAFELDYIEQFTSSIIQKFTNQKREFMSRTVKEVKKDLYRIKEELDSTSWGSLFTFSYADQRNRDNDLLQTIELSYIKTYESYLILRIVVSPSKKFNDQLAHILTQKDVGHIRSHYRSLWQILTTGRFLSGEGHIISIKRQNLRNLLQDVQHQVYHNCTHHLRGIFQKERSGPLLPSIEYYEIGSLEKWAKDRDLQGCFIQSARGTFVAAGEDTQIRWTDTNYQPQILVQVIRQRGEVPLPDSEYSWAPDQSRAKTRYLLQSLGFPCAFEAILLGHRRRLITIKRRVYDFMRDNTRRLPARWLLPLFSGRRFIRLKLSLSRLYLILKRFENEQVLDILRFHTIETDLTSFRPVQHNNPYSNLREKLHNNIQDSIKDLDQKSRNINDIFRSIEEVNTYRTNITLQVISILIALLAFIFTFNLKKYLAMFYKLLACE